MSVIAHDIETVSVTYCNDPGCPHYRKRTMAICFDRCHWETASFVPAGQLQGAVSDREALARYLRWMMDGTPGVGPMTGHEARAMVARVLGGQ